MANHKSAVKSIRKAARRTEINKNRVSRVRTYIRKVEEAIEAGIKEPAHVALRDAEKEIMRGVNKGIIHHNTASRKVSRLFKRVKALGAA